MRRVRSEAIGIALGTLLAAGCGGGDGPVAAPEFRRPVRVVTVEQGPAVAPLTVSGKLAARDEARLSFKTGGVIRSIAVREGQSVTAGQELAALEGTEIDAAVTQAREAYEKARRDLERGRKLERDDVISREQLDNLATAEAVARAALTAAEYNRGYATIKAPADGRVLRRLAQPRELVAGGQPVLVIGYTRSGWVLQAGVSDREFLRLARGDEASVVFDAMSGRRFDGRVVELGQDADPRTGTYGVDIEVDAGDALLVSGLVGSARVTGTAAAPAGARRSYLPLAALVEGRQDAASFFVYDEQSQSVRQRRSAVAFIDGEHAALTEALPAGTQVVTDGAAYLHDGEVVRRVE